MSKQIIRLTESDLHNIIKESVKKIIKEMEDPRDGRLQYGINRTNEIFDACEQHRKEWTPNVSHLTPFGIIINKYYSDWISAVRHDYTAKERLITNINYNEFKGVNNGYQIVTDMFNERYN